MITMKLSVAMTTYNGEKYIIQQLDSIRNQTLVPDEVIICDDLSTDGTVSLVSNYISCHNLTNWVLIVNDRRLGWKQNFRKVAELSTGDIVFFSDQDDIWLENKIEWMSRLMQKYDMGCLYGESIKIDSNGKPLQNLNSVNWGIGNLSKIKFSPSFFTVIGLGCCMCVNRRVVNKYLQLGTIDDDHDSQCARIALFYDTLWRLDAPVIKYRVHQDNTSGISSERSYGTSSLDKRIADIKIKLAWLILVKNDILKDEEHARYLTSAIQVEKKRLRYLEDRDVWFFSLFPHYRCFRNLTMLIGDFAYKHNMNESFGKMRWKWERYKAALISASRKR